MELKSAHTAKSTVNFGSPLMILLLVSQYDLNIGRMFQSPNLWRDIKT